MKKAIITGASSGLGKEIAKKLLSKNVYVVNLSRHPCDLEGVENITLDLANQENLEQALALLSEKHPDVDLLVLNSGVLHWHELGEQSSKEVDDDFMINVTSSIKIVNKLASFLKKNSGDVVVIGSTSGYKFYPGNVVYSSSKFAVRGLIGALQADLKKEDVRVIGVHPGGMRTQLHEKAGSGLKPETLMDPEAIADLIVYTLGLPRQVEVSEIIINRKNP